MIRIAIIDDEENARYVLSKTLESYFDNIKIVGTADDVQTGIDLIKKEKPELVFLDIKMKSGTGFDLLQKMDNLDFEVVFVTAYDNFAVQAFEYSAFDYLLKPVKIKDLKKVIERFAERTLNIDSKNSKRLKILIENYSNGGKVNKIVISSNKGFDVVDLENIIRLEGESNYTYFHLQTGRKITASKTMKEYEGLLIPLGFFRIHQSHIINLRHVGSYMKGDGGTVLLSDGNELPVARNRKQSFIEKFI